MKILRITVKNIASLAGTHSVDFTQEPLKSAGLYSISGATGAGKSSLLDALCLALFDSTPRLKQVGQLEELADGEKQNNSRTLLRRGTANGFADVVFVGVDRQTWTARWAVRRSHSRVDGKLNPPEMTLFRGSVLPEQNGTVEVGGKKGPVQKAIVEKLGLTFEQFTRAVLLAQNEFAAFLKANDRERAEILQALTGTEQFEKISRAVYARAKEDQTAVDTLQSRLEGNLSLRPDERIEAEQRKKTAQEEVTQCEAKLIVSDSHLAWFNRLRDIEKGVKEATSNHEDAKVAREAAAPRQSTLEQTEFAQREASSLRTAQTNAAEKLEEAERQVETAKSQLQQHTAALEAATIAQQEARDSSQQCEARYATLRGDLNAARKLDVELEGAEANIRKAKEDLEKAADSADAAEVELTSATANRDQLRKELKAAQRDQEKLACYEPFAANAKGWLRQLDDAATANTDAAKAKTKSDKLAGQQAEHEERLSAEQKSFDALDAEWKQADTDLKAAEKREQQFNANELATSSKRLEEYFQCLSTLQRELEQRIEKRQTLDALRTETAELCGERDQNRERINELDSTGIPAAVAAVDVAQRQLDLMEQAVSDHAVTLRATLQEDEACPVCGSEHHPYEQHPPDLETAAIIAAQTGLQDLIETRDKLRDEQKQLIASDDAATKLIESNNSRLFALQNELNSTDVSNAKSDIVTEILSLADVEQADTVAERLESVAAERKTLSNQEAEYRQAADETQARRKAEEALREKRTQQKDLLAESVALLAKVTADNSVAKSSYEAASSRMNDAQVALGDLWSGIPNAKNDFVRNSAEFRTEFETFTEQSREIADTVKTLESRIAECRAAIDPLNNAAGQAKNTLDERTAAHQKAVGVVEDLTSQRNALFDGRAADDIENTAISERQSAAEAVETARTLRETADKQKQLAEQRKEAANRSREEFDSADRTASERVTEWLKRFDERYSRTLSIAELQQMLERDDEWLVTEKRELGELDDRVTETRSRLQDRQMLQSEHAGKRPTTDDESVVQERLELLRKQLKEAKDRSDKAAAEVAGDDRTIEQNKELAQKIAGRAKQADPWIKLNALIGSKEGDKFRMIAQRRTLDVLLSYANHQLRQLAARYRLERLPESLNLIVIDEYMGDERRSVHSLSGGESFLVSLSLALGLASLTSSRLKIESLFIDEGFGSLDPETLNTAMSALMHLEAQGRKVGVISHVKEMTDAIPVQVRVVKRRGGASKIVIPGAVVEHIDVSAEAVARTPMCFATEVVAILRREQSSGKEKVSIQALRKELNCETSVIRAAQQELNGQVLLVGRSLQLTESTLPVNSASGSIESP